MRTSDFDYDLPQELIAQHPASERDQSRLLVLYRSTGRIEHRRFVDLPDYFRSGDVVVLNNSRVIPARLRGLNARTGGQFEVLLVEEIALNDWWVMLRPGKRARVGTEILFRNRAGAMTAARATVVEANSEGHRRLRFDGVEDIKGQLDEAGEVPLPPYIRRAGPGNLEEDLERYQTLYAGPSGSVAAPTAGLHFTGRVLEEIRARGTSVQFTTLHVGLGTFAPVKNEAISAHQMHKERYELGAETALAVNKAKAGTGRVFAVGTTTVRTLETRVNKGENAVSPGAGRTGIFIYPPYQFKIVDALLTNFHLPRSTLLMLLSAFAAPGETSGRELVLRAYAEAIRERYRFYSYGDAMLVL